MLFTVVEARDGRLVADTADRKVQMILAGPHAASGLAVGDEVTLTHRITITPAIEVVAVSSGVSAPDDVPEAEDEPLAKRGRRK